MKRIVARSAKLRRRRGVRAVAQRGRVKGGTARGVVISKKSFGRALTRSIDKNRDILVALAKW